MRIRYTRRARSDIDEVFSYIAKDNPDAARRVARAIVATVELIAKNPFIGMRNARATELRSCLVARFPYRLHNRVHQREIEVLHVRHTARRPFETSP